MPMWCSTVRCLVALTLSMLMASRAVEAQQVGQVSRIGYLGARTVSTSGDSVAAFQQGLRGLGYVEGQNLVMEYRWGEGKVERLPDLAAELVRLKVDVIVAGDPFAARAAKQ